MNWYSIVIRMVAGALIGALFAWTIGAEHDAVIGVALGAGLAAGIAGILRRR